MFQSQRHWAVGWTAVRGRQSWNRTSASSRNRDKASAPRRFLLRCGVVVNDLLTGMVAEQNRFAQAPNCWTKSDAASCVASNADDEFVHGTSIPSRWSIPSRSSIWL